MVLGKIFIFAFLLMAGFFMTTSIELGDPEDVCLEGQYIRVTNGTWECSNFTAADLNIACEFDNATLMRINGEWACAFLNASTFKLNITQTTFITVNDSWVDESGDTMTGNLTFLYDKPTINFYDTDGSNWSMRTSTDRLAVGKLTGIEFNELFNFNMDGYMHIDQGLGMSLGSTNSILYRNGEIFLNSPANGYFQIYSDENLLIDGDVKVKIDSDNTKGEIELNTGNEGQIDINSPNVSMSGNLNVANKVNTSTINATYGEISLLDVGAYDTIKIYGGSAGLSYGDTGKLVYCSPANPDCRYNMTIGANFNDGIGYAIIYDAMSVLSKATGFGYSHGLYDTTPGGFQFYSRFNDGGTWFNTVGIFFQIFGWGSNTTFIQSWDFDGRENGDLNIITGKNLDGSFNGGVVFGLDNGTGVIEMFEGGAVGSTHETCFSDVTLDGNDFCIYDELEVNGNAHIGGHTNISDSLEVKGNITGSFIYGEQYFDTHEGLPLNFAIANTYYNLTFNATGQMNGFTNNTIYNLIPLVDGIYKVTATATGSGQNNHIYIMTIGVNGIEKHNCHAQKQMSAGGDETELTIDCLLSLSTNDEVSLMIMDYGGTGAGVYYESNLNIFRIGG